MRCSGLDRHSAGEGKKMRKPHMILGQKIGLADFFLYFCRRKPSLTSRNMDDYHAEITH